MVILKWIYITVLYSISGMPHLYYLITDTNAVEKAMGTGVVLIVTIIIINAITNFLSHRFHARLTGKS